MHCFYKLALLALAIEPALALNLPEVAKTLGVIVSGLIELIDIVHAQVQQFIPWP